MASPSDDDIAAAVSRWRREVLEPLLASRPAGPRVSQLSDRFSPDDLYSPATLLETDVLQDIGFPGEPPYTRGVQPNMYRGRLWTMRQYAGFGTAAESNARYRYLLAQGQTGLSVAFDLPTQMGRDSDAPSAAGEVGKVGVAIDSLDDMETLLAELPLERISTSMTINSTAGILLALYVAVAEKRGVPAAELRGTIQNDILKEYIARGTYIYPPSPSLRLTKDIFAWATEHVPRWNVISISGYHMREAGCDAPQEVAFTLADGLEYVKTACDAGLDVNAFGEQLSFFFNGHSNVLEEVAKFRAARRLWARLVAERFPAANARVRALRFHCQTAGASLQAQQPMSNVVRVALQALAAVLGGCQSLHTNSYDEALGLPAEQAVTLALRTQQIIAHESGVTDFVDPLAGSYVIEALTDRIERRAREHIARVDQLGGMVRAIEDGYVQREIQQTSYQYALAVERKERIVVGVNEFRGESPPIPVQKVDPRVEREQVERVRAVRAARDASTAACALERIERTAGSNDNLMPPILAAVRAHATVGEISDALRRVFGEHVEHVTL